MPIYNPPTTAGVTALTTPISWSAGSALTAGNWSIGRNTATPNDLQFNVPTNSQFVFSWQGTNQLIMSYPVANVLNLNTANTATASTIYLQNQTFSPGSAHNALVIQPTWAAEDFAHNGLNIGVTQNGGNTDTVGLVALALNLTKAIGGSILTNAHSLRIGAPTSIGTITNYSALTIVDLNVANITNPRVMRIEGTGIQNAIAWGNSALQYANAANNVRFMDSTNARGIDFNLTAAGNQTITHSGGGLILTATGGSMGFFGTAPATQQAGVENITNNVTVGGVDGTIANFTDLATYANDAGTIRNNIYQLARSLKQCKDALRLYGLLS